MPMLNIFDNDAFSVTSLTDTINNIPYVPGLIGRSGLFQETPVTTTSVAIEQKDGQLILVPPTPRGAPGTTVAKGRRSMLDLRVPHFEINDAIMADEVQNVRAWGSEDELETVQGMVAGRLQEHSQSMEVTAEYSRIGAIKGIVTYADGSTLNLFTTFGVSQVAERAFDFANKKDGNLRAYADATVRLIADALGGVPYAGIRAECSDSFWDAMLKNDEIRASYLQQQEASQLREGTAYSEFKFADIVWRNYRGKVGNQNFIENDKAHLYPVGVPGLFRTYYAPADYEETVNTLGQRLYVKQYAMQNGKGRNLDVQTNALHICTRPRALIKAKLGS